MCVYNLVYQRNCCACAGDCVRLFTKLRCFGVINKMTLLLYHYRLRFLDL